MYPNKLLLAAVSRAPVESCTNLRRFHVSKARPQRIKFTPVQISSFEPSGSHDPDGLCQGTTKTGCGKSH